MIEYLEIPTFPDDRGSLSTVEFDELPFVPKRLFYLHNCQVGAVRAKHAHKKCELALICLSGSFRVVCKKGDNEINMVLDLAGECLIVHPGTWHSIECIEEKSVLLAVASEKFDPSDFED